MKQYSFLAKRGTDAVHRMREQKLRNGHPFMINIKDEGVSYCYLEFPDGRIQEVNLKSTGRDFNVIRDLSLSEAASLRLRFHI